MVARRILIVEDEIIIAMDLEDTLARWGFEASTVISGEAALRQAAELRPDLVFMDIQLAGPMNGFEAARELRARFGVRCIFLSAFNSPDFVREAQTAEPLGCLTKPVHGWALRALLEQALPEAGPLPPVEPARQ